MRRLKWFDRPQEGGRLFFIVVRTWEPTDTSPARGETVPASKHANYSLFAQLPSLISVLDNSEVSAFPVWEEESKLKAESASSRGCENSSLYPPA